MVMRSPTGYLDQRRMELDMQRANLLAAQERRVADVKHALVRLTASMDALSPLKVLSRGYAIASGSGGAVLRRAADAEIGEKINVRLGDGSLGCRVEERKENDGDG